MCVSPDDDVFVEALSGTCGCNVMVGERFRVAVHPALPAGLRAAAGQPVFRFPCAIGAGKLKDYCAEAKELHDAEVEHGGL